VDHVWSKFPYLVHQSYGLEWCAATSLLPKPKDLASSDERISQGPGELKLGIGGFQDKQDIVPCIERQSESGGILREMK